MHVALMRGLNVGGKNRLPMVELAAAFEAEGCSDVRTYVQSGNVVFAAPAGVVEGLADAVAERLRAVHGITTPVVLRTGEEIATVVGANPFLARGEDIALQHVAFLSGVPAPADVESLDPDRSPPDEFAVVGREVYLHLPGGVGRTRITNAYLDRRLGVVSTARNWRTVLALADMAGG
ncbi:MAG: DUF1697 domain-containing protein [Acidimicrobiia bacterium]|nr:DUF1697 domain-containing protein [Acidimicrobiia bacterium]